MPTSSTNSPTKSIRSQIENAS